MKASKTLSVALTATMLMGMASMTGCSSTTGRDKREPVKVTDDTPWYSRQYKDILDTESFADTDDHYEDYIGKSGDEYVFSRSVFHNTGSNISYDEISYMESYDDSIILYNPETSETREIDLQKIASDNNLIDESTIDVTIDNQSAGDTINLTMTVMIGMYEGFETYNISIDPASGEVIDIKESSEDDSFFMDYDVYMYGKAFYAGGHTLEVGLVYFNDLMSLVLRGVDDNGKTFDCKVEDLYPTSGVFDVFDPIYLSESDLLIKLKTYGDNTDNWIEVNYADGTVTTVDRDMSYLEGFDLNNVCYSEEFGNIILCNDGIIKIDPVAGTTETVFSFDWCNINRNSVKNMTLLGMDDDSVYLFDSTPSIDFEGIYHYLNQMVELERCDTNPNIGKTILKVASFDDFSDPVSEAICNFNETNTEYFIEYIDDYNLLAYGDIYADTAYIAALDSSVEMEMQYFLEEQAEADINEFYIDAGTNLSNKIIVDLMAGDGPDIILDAVGHSELNNSDYLLDLNDYLDSDLSPYFGNIIESAYVDGDLYNIPLLFSLSGLATNYDNVSDGQVGFTMEQYQDFVENVCNGHDPMAMTRLNFFSQVLATMDEDYVDGGDVDFNTDGFRALADYALNYVDDNAERNTSRLVEYCEWNNLTAGMNMGIGDTTALLGVPSLNGAGPSINCLCSAAIAADTSSPEGCWSFIKSLLSNDAQVAMASYGFPVSVAAFEEAANAMITSYQEYYDAMVAQAGEAMAARLGIIPVDPEMLPVYEDIIRSAGNIYSYDAPVMKVVREEIQAYFAGSKTLDDVIDLINNRAQTFYDERD